MALSAVFGPFGWLIPACALWIVFALDCGWLLFPTGPRRLRLLGGLTAAVSASVAWLQLLFYLGGLWPSVLLISLCAGVLGLHLFRRSRRARERHESAISLHEFKAVWPMFAVAVGALGSALLSAYWLPIWQWDSLGYHLPFVNFVMQDGGIAGLPLDVGYLSTYPRNVELLFTAMRATLPDDRLIDIGQIPFGLMAAAGTVGIARELGASRTAASTAGVLFLALPAVFLQLPTNYVDVGTAAFFILALFFLLVAPTAKTLVLAGLCIGLFMGTKPSAPPQAALLGVVLLARAQRASLLRVGLGALVFGLALGAEAYLVQLIRHGNPVWPAVVKIGPWELPGTISVNELLSSGAGAQKVHGSMPYRIVASWTSWSAAPYFDMRVGGLGQAFWIAFPLALWGLIRRRSVLLVALSCICLVTPDPAVVRYVFQFPALVLALAAAELCYWRERTDGWSRTARQAASSSLVGLAAACGAYQLYYAFPGLTGEGPLLWDYAGMTWSEREGAVGANGRPTAFIEARQRLQPGEVAVYDKAFWLPYLMWRSDAANRVVRLPDQVSEAEARALLDRPDTRLIAAGKDQPVWPVLLARRDYRVLFECREPCSVYFKQ